MPGVGEGGEHAERAQAHDDLHRDAALRSGRAYVQERERQQRDEEDDASDRAAAVPRVEHVGQRAGVDELRPAAAGRVPGLERQRAQCAHHRGAPCTDQQPPRVASCGGRGPEPAGHDQSAGEHQRTDEPERADHAEEEPVEVARRLRAPEVGEVGAAHAGHAHAERDHPVLGVAVVGHDVPHDRVGAVGQRRKLRPHDGAARVALLHAGELLAVAAVHADRRLGVHRLVEAEHHGAGRLPGGERLALLRRAGLQRRVCGRGPGQHREHDQAHRRDRDDPGGRADNG